MRPHLQVEAWRRGWTAFGDVSDTEYGMREFAFVDPAGTLHRVGSRPAPRS